MSLFWTLEHVNLFKWSHKVKVWTGIWAEYLTFFLCIFKKKSSICGKSNECSEVAAEDQRWVCPLQSFNFKMPWINFLYLTNLWWPRFHFAWQYHCSSERPSGASLPPGRGYVELMSGRRSWDDDRRARGRFSVQTDCGMYQLCRGLPVWGLKTSSAEILRRGNGEPASVQE